MVVVCKPSSSASWAPFWILLGTCHLLQLMQQVQRVDGSSSSSGYIQCEPCPGDPLQVTVSTEDDDGTTTTTTHCRDLFSATDLLAAETSECRDAQLRNYQNRCCGDDEEPPPGMCTLCPDGSMYDGTAVVPSFDPSADDSGCADLNVDPSYLDYIFADGTCSDTLLRRSAAWCGCPGVERSCFLCPDGSRPPNPGLVDPVYYGWSCDSFDFVSSYFTADECRHLAEDVFEFDAPSWCGCPGVPIPDVCRLCPEGQRIVRPKEVLDDGAFTCRELALSTRYIPSRGPCDRVVNSYRSKGYVDYCCGPDVTSGAAPTAVAVKRPGRVLLLLQAMLLAVLGTGGAVSLLVSMGMA
jgi:hypothetical protein